MILICIFSFTTLVLSYLMNKSLLNPITFFILYWTIQFVLTLILIPNNSNLQLSGYYYIISIFLIMILADFIVKYYLCENRYNYCNNQKFQIQNVDFKYLKLAIISSIILGMLYLVLKLKESGANIGTLFNLDELAKIVNKISVQRYAGEEKNSMIAQILLTFIYLPPCFAGLLLALKPFKRYQIYLILCFIPSLLVCLVQSTRSIVLSNLCCFLGVYISFSLFKYGKDFKLLKFKNLILLLLGIVLFIGLFSFAQMLRGGKVKEFNDVLNSSMIENIKIYVSGHVPAFSTWFENYKASDLSFGAYTFASIFNILGLKYRELGIYRDYVYLFEDRGTNIYTYFRGFIQDFGVLFSYIIFLILGAIGSLSYHKIMKKKFKYILLLILFYIITLFFPSSFLNYTTHILSLMLFFIYLLFAYNRDSVL